MPANTLHRIPQQYLVQYRVPPIALGELVGPEIALQVEEVDAIEQRDGYFNDLQRSPSRCDMEYVIKHRSQHSGYSCVYVNRCQDESSLRRTIEWNQAAAQLLASTHCEVEGSCVRTRRHTVRKSGIFEKGQNCPATCGEMPIVGIVRLFL